MTKDNKISFGEKATLWGVIGFILIIALLFTVYTIPAGYRGVVLTFGKPSQVISDEGLNFKVPFAQSVKKIEVRTQKIESDADSTSRDLQDVQATIALNYHVIPSEVNTLYQELGEGYRERVVDPAIQESIKSVMAQYTAEELVTKRPQVRQDIEVALSEKLLNYHVHIDSFNIVNFQFSEEYDKAIEEKVVAEQKKLKAQRDLERIQIEAEQVKTQADAEAYSLQKKSQAIKDSPQLVDLKNIEVKEKALAIQQMAIEKWDGILPIFTGGGSIPLIQLDENFFAQNADNGQE